MYAHGMVYNYTYPAGVVWATHTFKHLVRSLPGERKKKTKTNERKISQKDEKVRSTINYM